MYHIIIVDSVLATKIDAHPKVRTRAVRVYWDIYGTYFTLFDRTYHRELGYLYFCCIQKVAELKQSLFLLEEKLTGSIEDNMEAVVLATRPDPAGSLRKTTVNNTTTTEDSMVSRL